MGPPQPSVAIEIHELASKVRTAGDVDSAKGHRRASDVHKGAGRGSSVRSPLLDAEAEVQSEQCVSKPDLPVEQLLPHLSNTDLLSLFYTSRSLAILVLKHAPSSRLTLTGYAWSRRLKAVQLHTTLPGPQELVLRDTNFGAVSGGAVAALVWIVLWVVSFVTLAFSTVGPALQGLLGCLVTSLLSLILVVSVRHLISWVRRPSSHKASDAAPDGASGTPSNGVVTDAASEAASEGSTAATASQPWLLQQQQQGGKQPYPTPSLATISSSIYPWLFGFLLITCVISISGICGILNSLVMRKVGGFFIGIVFVFISIIVTVVISMLVGWGLELAWLRASPMPPHPGPPSSLAPRSLQCTGCVPLTQGDRDSTYRGDRSYLSTALSLLDPAQLQRITIDDGRVCHHLAQFTALQQLTTTKPACEAPGDFQCRLAACGSVNDECFEHLLWHPSLTVVSLHQLRLWQDYSSETCSWEQLILEEANVDTLAHLPQGIGSCIVRGSILVGKHGAAKWEAILTAIEGRPQLVFEPTPEPRAPTFVIGAYANQRLITGDTARRIYALCAREFRAARGAFVLQHWHISTDDLFGLGLIPAQVNIVEFRWCQGLPSNVQSLFGFLPRTVTRVDVLHVNGTSAEPTAHWRI